MVKRIVNSRLCSGLQNSKGALDGRDIVVVRVCASKLRQNQFPVQIRVKRKVCIRGKVTQCGRRCRHP